MYQATPELYKQVPQTRGYNIGQVPEKAYNGLENTVQNAVTYSITQHSNGDITQAVTYHKDSFGFDTEQKDVYNGEGMMPYMAPSLNYDDDLMRKLDKEYISIGAGAYHADDLGGMDYSLDSAGESSERIFETEDFVTKRTRFVNDAEDIMPYIKETFKLTTGKEFPKNITIAVLDKKELKKAHKFFNGQWTEGIQGFCINRKKGEKRVFAKKDELARIMLTIGHEIGHLQTASLKGVDEEAKAFAFSIEWMNKIREHNVANLQDCLIAENPAKNGLHDVAFNKVRDMLNQGKQAMDVFNSLLEEKFKYYSC